MTADDEIQAIVAAVKGLHGASARWLDVVPVCETWGDVLAWEGAVHVLGLEGHPTATRCYAWSHETEGGRRKLYAVLHGPPVDSSAAAVRAAIVSDYRSSPGGR